jgi:hypothetical protein
VQERRDGALGEEKNRRACEEREEKAPAQLSRAYTCCSPLRRHAPLRHLPAPHLLSGLVPAAACHPLLLCTSEADPHAMRRKGERERRDREREAEPQSSPVLIEIGEIAFGGGAS